MDFAIFGMMGLWINMVHVEQIKKFKAFNLG